MSWRRNFRAWTWSSRATRRPFGPRHRGDVRPRRYYKAAHWTRGWADREKAARFVAEVTAFGRKEEAYTRDFHAAARRVWGPRGF